MGSASSLASQRSWKKSSACARVLWKIERRAVALHFGQHVGDGVAAAAAGPRRAGFSCEHPDVGVGAGVCVKDGAGVRVAGEEARDLARVVHGGGESHAAEAGAEGLRRASASISWSPRFDSDSAWISSTMTRSSPAKVRGASS